MNRRVKKIDARVAGSWAKPGAMITAVLAALALSPAFAATFTETFTTTAYKDAGNTTADWNTAAGQLQLAPFTPSLVGSYNNVDIAYHVTVVGDLAFIADDHDVLIVDIANPSNPTLVGNYNTFIASRVAVAGDLAFVASFVGLTILDVSDPANPTPVGSSLAFQDNRDVVVAGDRAFIANSSAGLLILDISNPAIPALVGTYDTPGSANSVAVAGTLAFIADATFGLHIIDVTNPATPALVATVDTPGNALEVVLAGDIVFVADDSQGIQLVDIANPVMPVLMGTYNTPGNAKKVAVAGDLAFVGDGGPGLQIVNVANPVSPVLVGTYNTPGFAHGVAVAGEHAFIADWSSGLQIVRIGTPVPPAPIGTYNSPGTAYGVDIRGDLAFVADGTLGLRLVNITNPTSPASAGTYNTPGTAYGVAVSGNLAFVADDASGLQIVDVSNPASPTLEGTYDTAGLARGVVVDGDHAFVADASAGLVIVDISNPASPTLTGTYDTSGAATGVAVAGDYAFVADGTAGLRVVDITDPTSPALLGTYDTPGAALGVAVAGDLAFVADAVSGLLIVDVSNPASPTLVGTYDTLGNAFGVVVAGDFAFVASEWAGLYVIDISNPASPVLFGSYDTLSANGIAIAGEVVYVADGTDGLRAIQVFQHDVNNIIGVGRSLPIDGFGHTLQRAWINSTQTGNVSWELSANGGANFQTFTPGAWTAFTVLGNDLIWRTTHTWQAPGGNPTVSDVTIDWLYEFGLIASVTDIPNDQGRQVRVTWNRSSHDFVGDPQQVVEYAIYRQIDPDLAKPNLGAMNHRRASRPNVLAGTTLDGASSIARDHARMMLALGWDFVASVPVFLDDNYSAVVPTLADSTITDGQYRSVFRVTALTATPGVFFHSPPDSGYSVDNLAPALPQGFVVVRGENSVELGWQPAPDVDFRYFRVYRSADADFLPGPATLVHETTSTSWQDDGASSTSQFYKLTAVDHSGNESDPASTDPPTAVEEHAAMPGTFALRGATPNPARSQARIAFDLPAQVAVTLHVYDVAGRVVRTLARGTMPAGAHAIGWNGRDESGQQVPAGLYLYRLRAAGFESTGRLTLIR